MQFQRYQNINNVEICNLKCFNSQSYFCYFILLPILFLLLCLIAILFISSRIVNFLDMKLKKVSFKNEKWSEIGKLRSATHRTNVLFFNQQFILNGHFLRWVYFGIVQRWVKTINSDLSMCLISRMEESSIIQIWPHMTMLNSKQAPHWCWFQTHFADHSS